MRMLHGLRSGEQPTCQNTWRLKVSFLRKRAANLQAPGCKFGLSTLIPRAEGRLFTSDPGAPLTIPPPLEFARRGGPWRGYRGRWRSGKIKWLSEAYRSLGFLFFHLLWDGTGRARLYPLSLNWSEKFVTSIHLQSLWSHSHPINNFGYQKQRSNK